jgi:hypothetical protein
MAIEVDCFSATKSTVFYGFLCGQPGSASSIEGVLSV